MGIPLPSIRTLQKWGERITISPGILYDCFTILNAVGTNLTEEERQVREFTFLFGSEFFRPFYVVTNNVSIVSVNCVR